MPTKKTSKNTNTVKTAETVTKKRATSKKESPVNSEIFTTPENTTAESLSKSTLPKLNITNILYSRRTYIAILVVGLLLLIYYKKSWFLAATVNNTPITTIELFQRMNQQYREQTVNQLINEKIILHEARKNNISVQPSEIDEKIAEFEKNIGSQESLDLILQQQGMTREMLRDQVKLTLMRDKLYENEATVSAEEVTQFVEANRDQLRATESAAQREEAEQILKQQKIGQIFAEKFQKLRDAANISIF